MENKVDIKENYIYQLNDKLLEILLKDHSSNKNILWATDNYKHKGTGYYTHDNITLKAITGRNGLVIKPRVEKSKKEQDLRIKQKAEVFTPSWICNDMANNLDETWFEKQGVFNVKNDKTWTVNTNKIPFTNKTWQDYVKLKVLEISCGEAPFLVSRYDTVTGKWLDVNERIGMLDRKLRVVNENTDNIDDWLYWATEAFKATFGYEWQGDSLLIARENLLFTFIDYYSDRFNTKPTDEQLIEIAKILSWNIWQMDGLKYVIPNSCKPVPKMQLSIFEDEEPEECPSCKKGNNHSHTGIYSKIMNWDTKRSIKFYKGEKKMKFDFVIGNPPYQDQGGSGGNNDAPIYQDFIMSSRNIISKSMSFVIPARWFSAGRDNLLGSFRNYMMTTNSLKSMVVFTDSHDLFPNVEIKGGVCHFVLNKDYDGMCNYTYNNGNIKKSCLRNLGEFEVIIRDPKLSDIVKKVLDTKPLSTVDSIVSSDTPFGISSNPKSSKKNTIEIYDNMNQEHSTLLYHIENNKRKIEYVDRRDISKNSRFIDSFKIFIPGGYGAGESFPHQILGKPEIAPANSVCSQSYLFVAFQKEVESINFSKYLKTRFFRALVSAIKITQSAPSKAYKFVPMQDFTEKSDIDWSKSIKEIDNQLYKKYGLEDDEINFIETHIKEMD